MDPRLRGVSTGKQRRALEKAMARQRPAAAVPNTYDATDAAAALMAKERINPLAVSGTGANGRIGKSDVEAWMKERETA